MLAQGRQSEVSAKSPPFGVPSNERADGIARRIGLGGVGGRLPALSAIGGFQHSALTQRPSQVTVIRQLPPSLP